MALAQYEKDSEGVTCIISLEKTAPDWLLQIPLEKKVTNQSLPTVIVQKTFSLTNLLYRVFHEFIS